MNTETLDALLDRYEANLDMLYDDENNELFKWRALKTFQREWFSAQHTDFLTRFNAATKDFSVLIDNSRMHPRNGVVKLYEKEPQQVEHLFLEVLFADDHGDLAVRQNHMDLFLNEMEKLREKYYPANWSFKQDRHSASTFLAMYAPTENYIYKFSEAETMAVNGEYGFDLGSGADFDLSRYYGMCDEIVERLKQHESLVNRHFKKLSEKCYYVDHSLHLLAFDMMYCCRTYGFYKGLSHIAKKESIKLAKEAEVRKEAAALWRQKVDALVRQIEDLELSLPDVSDISLLHVEVTSKAYGTGTVIEHEGNKIKVQFSDATRPFILDKIYPQRPTFENDEEVVEAYSEYASITKQIEALKRDLERLTAASGE